MTVKIDLGRLIKFLLKRIWIPILCAVIGFGGMYCRAAFLTPDRYTATATMYVYNGNPNVVNYQYTNTTDLNTAVMLVDTYMVVIKSNKVMDRVAERLNNTIPTEYIADSLSVGSVSETGIMTISSTTGDPQLSMEICNAVVDIAPAEIIRVVSAGAVEVIDYADLPLKPNSKQAMRNGIIGALAGLVLSCGVLVLLFLLNRKLTESRELTDNYTLPLLSVIGKLPNQERTSDYLISDKTEMSILSGYTKLRTNLAFAMRETMKTILVSSSIPGESKSTLTGNLALSFAMTGKKVLLIDADMRKPSQYSIFGIPKNKKGLSDMLASADESITNIIPGVRENLDVLPAGSVPPNPSELMDSTRMRKFLSDIEKEYDVVIMDLPPINVVHDALILSDVNAGMLFVTRCNYSDHREIRKALISAEFTGIKILGMVMTCATKYSDDHYSHYYDKYYNAYDMNKRAQSSRRRLAGNNKK